ncbi:MAG TPA: stage III sporulation protein AA, partial [Firmicutes bacterium]|nr:stage III sporulation protein AA [Bacillota bacterium]
AHARDLAEARQRPVLRGLLAEGYFQRAVILGRREGRPEIAGVAELPGGKLIYRGEM